MIKINWGNVFWGVLIALNVAVFISLVIEGHWLCATGWLLAALYGLIYRIEASVSEIWERVSRKWYEESLELRANISTLKSELEKANAEENKD